MTLSTHGGTKPLGVSVFSAFNAKQTLMEAGCCLAVAANTAKLLRIQQNL